MKVLKIRQNWNLRLIGFFYFVFTFFYIDKGVM